MQFGFQSVSLAKGGNRIVQPALLEERQAKIVLPFGRLRMNAQALPEMRRGLRKLLIAESQNPESGFRRCGRIPFPCNPRAPVHIVRTMQVAEHSQRL